MLSTIEFGNLTVRTDAEGNITIDVHELVEDDTGITRGAVTETIAYDTVLDHVLRVASFAAGKIDLW